MGGDLFLTYVLIKPQGNIETRTPCRVEYMGSVFSIKSPQGNIKDM